MTWHAFSSELISARETWMPRGACASSRTSMFPEDAGGLAAAKAVCARCPVRIECRDHALGVPEPAGVRGGLSETERHALLHPRRSPRRGPGGQAPARPELLALPGVVLDGEGHVTLTDPDWLVARIQLAADLAARGLGEKRWVRPEHRVWTAGAIYKLGHGVRWLDTQGRYGSWEAVRKFHERLSRPGGPWPLMLAALGADGRLVSREARGPAVGPTAPDPFVPPSEAA